MLSTLSESGRKVLRGRPGWIRKVNADVQRMGNATISRVSVELGARGGVAGMTMAAIPLDEFIDHLESSTPRKRDERKKR